MRDAQLANANPQPMNAMYVARVAAGKRGCAATPVLSRVLTPDKCTGDTREVADDGLLRRIDAVTIPVPDLDQGLLFYREALGHDLLWRDDSRGQAGLRMPETDAEIVLTRGQAYEPNWLVTSAPAAARAVADAGGRIVSGPFDIPVGSVVVVA